MGGIRLTSAPPKYLVMLHRGDWFYVVAVCLERFRASLHYRCRSSTGYDGWIPARSNRFGQLLSGIPSARPLRPRGTKACAAADGGHVRCRASDFPGAAAVSV